MYITMCIFTTHGKYPRELRGRIVWRCRGIIGALLDVQFLMVLTHSSSLCSEGVEHYSRVDEIFLHTLEPCIQLLKPHQLSSIYG